MNENKLNPDLIANYLSMVLSRKYGCEVKYSFVPKKEAEGKTQRVM